MDKIRTPAFGAIFSDKKQVKLARKYWKVVFGHLAKNKLVSEARLIVAGRYVQTLVELDTIAKDVHDEGPVKAGPNGGDVYSLYFAAKRKLNLPGFTGDCLVLLKRLYLARSGLHSMPALPELV